MTILSGSGNSHGARTPGQAGLPEATKGQGRKEVIVRSYREGDEYGIIRLFKEVFGREMSLGEWRWKYKGQGNDTAYSVVAVNSDGEVVGHYGGVPVRAVYLGREVRALLNCDVMIHRAFRGFWLLKRIMASFVQDAMNNGFSTAYGFPTEETLMLPTEKLGIMERCAVVREAKKKVARNNTMSRFTFRLFLLGYFDRRIDGLWKALRDSYDFALVRDADYFRWRYRDNPLFSYRIWGLGRRWGRDLSGLVVTKEGASEEMSLMDILCRPAALVPLLQKAENLALAAGKKELLLWMSGAYRPLLAGNGFTISDRGVIAQPKGKDFVSREEIGSRLYFTMGDTDYL
jgi:hypothetical protein